jgi:hypothetical protein
MVANGDENVARSVVGSCVLSSGCHATHISIYAPALTRGEESHMKIETTRLTA